MYIYVYMYICMYIYVYSIYIYIYRERERDVGGNNGQTLKCLMISGLLPNKAPSSIKVCTYETWGVSRETLCLFPLPSHNIPPMSNLARRRATAFRGQMQVLRLSQN